MMFKNYLVTAFRSLLRNKTASIISIAGLALGMACALLIFLYIQFELSYDSFHTKRELIYRVLIKGERKTKDKSVEYRSSVVYSLGPELMNKFKETQVKKENPSLFQKSKISQKPVVYPAIPGEETIRKEDRLVDSVLQPFTYPDLDPVLNNVVRMSPQTGYVRYKDNFYEEENFYFTDPLVLKMFDFPLKKGSPDTALLNPDSLVLTQEMAEKYFGSQDPLGKKISLKVSYAEPFLFTVTGVLEPVPKNSSIQINFLASGSFNTLKKSLPKWQPLYTYIFIEFGGIKRKQPESMFKQMLKDLIIMKRPVYVSITANDFNKSIAKIKLPDFYADNIFQNWHFTTEPFQGSYFANKSVYIANPGQYTRQEKKGNFLLLVLLFLLGFLILCVSCINVMNLSTARSANRAREIGLRKIMGADQGQLIFQFLTESTLLSILSLILSLSLVELSLPWFNKMVFRNLVIDYAGNWGFLLAMVGITVLVGLISGLYPAFFLSSFQPVETLKGENLPASITLRKRLMIFQLGVSVCIFIFSFLVSGETRFLRNKSLGFDKNNIIFFKADDPNLNKSYPDFKNALVSLTGVHNVSASSQAAWQYGGLEWSTFSCPKTDKKVQTRVMLVDSDYFRVYGIPVVQGGNLPDYNSDGNKNNVKNLCIINHAAQKAFNINNISGKTLYHGGKYIRQIAGVVDDFHFQYPSKKIESLVMLTSDHYYGMQRPYISVKLIPVNQADTVKEIKKVFNKFFPNLIFKSDFIDKEIEKMFREINNHWEIILKFSTIISVFLAGLGLFGFAEYESWRKTREIGIRKALGATRIQIAIHFISHFICIAVTANIIAWPISYIFTQLTLFNITYPYPLKMGPLVFICAGLLTLILTIAAVSIQTFRAASMNPSDALRDE
ncbi:ABC transporter permease [Desulfobacterales bacterium HSG17]|nr:ABC transporter permease [Desulfobacterales bacterium HSG17]